MGDPIFEMVFQKPSLKSLLEPKVSKKTAYLFYCENGFDEPQQAKLSAAGVMYSDGDKLTSYETVS